MKLGFVVEETYAGWLRRKVISKSGPGYSNFAAQVSSGDFNV